MDHQPVWPLFGLQVRTPRLVLRYPDDADVLALAEVAGRGVHPPDSMPFLHPWTDAEPPYLQQGTAQWVWRTRADWRPEAWHLCLVAVVDGAVVGLQSAGARAFVTLRQAGTGSWLGLAHQGQGIGTEMRAAILHLVFAGLGATRALSGAFHDNVASRRVSDKLGYAENGSEWALRRGRPDRLVRLVLTRATWESHRRDDITIEGLDACRPLFGA